MRILYVTTISLTMNTFFKPHIRMLVEEGHQVNIACNDDGLPLDKLYGELGCVFHRVDFSRSPVSADNVRAYDQLKRIVASGNYDIVHCHTPNASVITRLVCRSFRKKTSLKVFYTAHGFHFYKGAPLLNWLVFYPVEKFCSRFTDKLITINKEDYLRAKDKFHAGEVHLVPGVGIDLSRFENVQVDRAAKRREIGVPEDAFLLLSVGELNKNKNNQIIIRAMAKLGNRSIHYAIAGVGEMKDELLRLANELGVADQVHLLGYRRDIPELNHSADVFCFPSRREGLGVAAIEALACGLPVVASRNRGTSEFIESEKNGYLCEDHDVSSFALAISNLVSDDSMRKRNAAEAFAEICRFRIDDVVEIVKGIYEG